MTTQQLDLWPHVLGGAIGFGFIIAGLFFLRFWTRTADRLFLIFAVAFWVMAIERVLLVGNHFSEATLPYIYLVRLVAFLLIIGAIIDKNRKGPR